MKKILILSMFIISFVSIPDWSRTEDVSLSSFVNIAEASGENSTCKYRYKVDVNETRYQTLYYYDSNENCIGKCDREVKVTGTDCRGTGNTCCTIDLKTTIITPCNGPNEPC